MSDFRDFPTDTRETRGDRDHRGRFQPGNATAKLGGRPTALREAEFLAASVAGCSPAQWTAVVDVVRKKALEGSAPHATLLARVLGLMRPDGTTNPESMGESAAGLLARPENAARVDELMTLLFAGQVTGSTASAEKGEGDHGA